MIRSGNRLYFYKCSNCSTTAVAAQKATYDDPYHCVLCRRYMKYLYVMPVQTDEERSWHRRGVVFNPGLGRDPLPGSMREIPDEH